jgi:hypothetical protein
MQKQTVVILMLFSLAIVALLSTNSSSQAFGQISTLEAVEFVQLSHSQRSRLVKACMKQGTIGTQS